MDVTDRRQDIAQMLRKELPDSYIVVPAPDHPLLIEAPDVLVGGDAGLTAIFTPKRSERRRPDRLAVRFILCRLALPAHTRHILVLEGPDDDRVGKRLFPDFAATLTWNRRRDLIKIAQDSDFVGQQRTLPVEISRLVQERFSDVFQLTRVLRTRRRREEGSALRPYGVSPGHGIKPERTPFEQVAPGVIFTRFERGVPKTRGIYGLVIETTSSGFALDSGIPYPRDANDYGLAVVEELPEYRGDPDKLVRAAAFAGWAFVTHEELDNVGRLGARLSKRREMRHSQ
jgi:hypothetical protein